MYYVAGCILLVRVKMDKRGRLLIPIDERKRLALKGGDEFDFVREGGFLILKPILPEPAQVDCSHRKWGKEAFLDSGDATFGS
jgi:AbrB family looped-hinge helix DNA binding protein